MSFAEHFKAVVIELFTERQLQLGITFVVAALLYLAIIAY
jgi:hypothetical protein